MAWLRAVAICGALTALPSLARGEPELTERLRLQGVYANQSGIEPPSDFAIQAAPELSLVVLGKRSQLQVTYTLAGTAHTTFPAEIANRVIVASTFELSKRTTMLLSAEAGHTSVTNALLSRSPADTAVGALPDTAGQLVTARIAEGTSWEASPVVRLGQLADASYVTTIDTPLSIETYLFNAAFSADRVWKADQLGIDLRAGYARSATAPLPPERLVPLALTPHWRHDISRSVTALFALGASLVVSPDSDTKPLAGPYARAAVSYLLDDSIFDATATVGTQADALTAQLLYADQITLAASTPLSVPHAIVASGSIGFIHGSIIELQRSAIPPPDFDSFFADVGLGWSPAPAVQLFVRYQFLDQITEDAANAATSTPALLRNAVILGVALTSRPNAAHVSARFPQRVDRSDGAPVEGAPAEAAPAQ